MKVWVVTSGSYSDYGIEGVFSTEERARDNIGQWGRRPQDMGIEEYEVDELVPMRVGPTWHVAISMRDGKILDYLKSARSQRDPRSCDVRRGGDGYISVTSPISREHAIKVAVEERQKWLREQR